MKGNGAYIQLKMHKDIVQVSTRTNLIKLEALYVGFAYPLHSIEPSIPLVYKSPFYASIFAYFFFTISPAVKPSKTQFFFENLNCS